jgi:hypothetical protein
MAVKRWGNNCIARCCSVTKLKRDKWLILIKSSGVRGGKIKRHEKPRAYWKASILYEALFLLMHAL